MIAWLRHRPFTTALLVLTAVVVPGFVRVQGIADDARDATVRLGEVVARQDRDAIEDAEARCALRNAASRNTRDRFEALFDALDALLPDDTDAQEFIDDLRTAVPLDPAAEDLDCDGDGALTEADYP